MITEASLIGNLTLFMLAIFLGFELITKVPATLHTPLMSGANAISGISVVGALLGANVAYQGGDTLVSGLLAFLALVLAMINVVGGFAVANRMLNMIAGKNRRARDARMDSTWLSALCGFVHLRTEETGPPTHGSARKSVRRSRYVGGRYHDRDRHATFVGWHELGTDRCWLGRWFNHRIIMAVRVEMTGMPELVALFNGFGGAASALVALSETWKYIENPDNGTAHWPHLAGGRCRSRASRPWLGG